VGLTPAHESWPWREALDLARTREQRSGPALDFGRGLSGNGAGVEGRWR
jgi:hypothetical protein